MFFQRIQTPGLAQVTYMIGDRGEVAVVDPRRDIDEYLRIARENGLAIRYIVETHRQEDFLIGSLELAQVTGARIVSGDSEFFGHSELRMQDGERLTLAGLSWQALQTPGHTPESTCYAVYVPDAPEQAWGVFTGDTLFIGATGRTDLSDTEKTAEHAGALYDAVHQKLLPLGDQALVLPAHGAGTVCGSQMAQRDWSTLGLERSYNPVFTLSREHFIGTKLRERLPHPPYFSRMARLNHAGGKPMPAFGAPMLQPRAFSEHMQRGLVIDTRSAEAFASGHIPGAYNIWLHGLPVFSGWIASETEPIYLVLERLGDLEDARLSLARVGLDRVEGVLAGGFEQWRQSGLPIEHSGMITPEELLLGRDGYQVLDVREVSEFEDEGHIPGATNVYVGHLEEQLPRLGLNPEERVAVTCSVGNRSSLAASILKRHGFIAVTNLLGGMSAWSRQELLKEGGPPRLEEPREERGRRGRPAVPELNTAWSPS